MSATASSVPSLVPEVLSEYGNITGEALKTYLPSHEPRRYLYDILADYPQRGGKMMRPSLDPMTPDRAWAAVTGLSFWSSGIG